jgi:hypothetical protein
MTIVTILIVWGIISVPLGVAVGMMIEQPDEYDEYEEDLK